MMLRSDALKDILSQELTDRDKSLICLAANPIQPRRVTDVKEIAYSAGWRQAKKKNFSSILGRANGFAVRGLEGWELTSNGKTYVAKLAGPLLNSPVPMAVSSLRAHLAKITDSDARSFVEEAITCFESRQYRAAVVLSWVGAISVLHNHVVLKKLAEFNNEAVKRNPKWKFAKSPDDLGLTNEDSFLDILQAISVIGKNVKHELKKALTLRNGCGHPNSLKVAEHKVSAHVEDLILNVYAVF